MSITVIGVSEVEAGLLHKSNLTASAGSAASTGTITCRFFALS